jgi:hypothetical protein
MNWNISLKKLEIHHGCTMKPSAAVVSSVEHCCTFPPSGESAFLFQVLNTPSTELQAKNQSSCKSVILHPRQSPGCGKAILLLRNTEIGKDYPVSCIWSVYKFTASQQSIDLSQTHPSCARSSLPPRPQASSALPQEPLSTHLSRPWASARGCQNSQSPLQSSRFAHWHSRGV